MPGGGTFLVDECGDNRYEGVSSMPQPATFFADLGHRGG